MPLITDPSSSSPWILPAHGSKAPSSFHSSGGGGLLLTRDRFRAQIGDRVRAAIQQCCKRSAASPTYYSHQPPQTTSDVTLDFSRCDISCDSLAELVTFLDEHQDFALHKTAITALSLTHNPRMDAATLISLLRAVVRLLPSLNCIDLFDVGLEDRAFSELLDCFSNLPNSGASSYPTTKIFLLTANAKAEDDEEEGTTVGLTKLKIGDNQITSCGVRTLCHALLHQPRWSALTQLHLGGNPIGGEGLQHLASAWSTGLLQIDNLALRDLPTPAATAEEEEEAFLFQKGLVQFFTAVAQGKPQLRELQLRGTLLGSAAMSALASCFRRPLVETADSALPSFSQLHAIDISACGCGESGLTEFLHAMYCASTQHGHLNLRELQMGNLAITVPHCAVLGSLLRGDAVGPCKLSILNVSNSCIVGTGLAQLFHGLRTHRTLLSTLNISGNDLSLEACQSIASLFQYHAEYGWSLFSSSYRFSLSTLLAHRCNLNPTGASILFRALAAYPCRLRALELPQNLCGDRSIDALCAMLQQNEMLMKLHLQDNDIKSERSMLAILESLHRNHGLRHVSIGGQSSQANALSAELRSEIHRVVESHKHRRPAPPPPPPPPLLPLLPHHQAVVALPFVSPPPPMSAFQTLLKLPSFYEGVVSLSC